MTRYCKITEYGLPDGQDDILEHGALDWLVNHSALPLLFEHKKHLIIGKAYQFTPKQDGIYALIEIYDTLAGKYVQKLIDADVLDSVSICYEFDASKYTHLTPEGFRKMFRRIKEINQVNEVSIVCVPACFGAVMEGKQSKKGETLKDRVERLNKFLGIGWCGKEADEINNIIYSRYRYYRDLLYYSSHY